MRAPDLAQRDHCELGLFCCPYDDATPHGPRLPPLRSGSPTSGGRRVRPRCAPGANAVCAAHSGPSARAAALRPGCAAAVGPRSLRAPPGVRRRVPLRLSGSACRAGPRPVLGPLRPPVALAAPPAAASGGSGPLASPGVLRFALGLLRAPSGCPPRLCGLPPAPWAARCAGAPLPRPGCARLRCACPAPSRRGACAALPGRFLRPRPPGVFWGFAPRPPGPALCASGRRAPGGSCPINRTGCILCRSFCNGDITPWYYIL